VIAEALFKLTASCEQMKEMWIDLLPAVHWAERFTIRQMTGHSPGYHGLYQDAIHPIVLTDGMRNTTQCTHAIDDTASLLASGGKQLETQ